MSRCQLRTTRLRLRPFGLADAHVLHRLLTDPAVRHYLLDDVVIPYSRAVEMLVENDRLFDEEELGLWAVHRARDAQLVGFGGYWYFFDPPERQIVYGLAPQWWGRGYATECVRALLHYGFTHLHLDEVVGATDVPNAASARVMARAGMRLRSRTLRDGSPIVVYALARDEYAPYDDSVRVLPGDRILDF